MKSRLSNDQVPTNLTHGWDENSIKYDANGNLQALRRDSSVQGTLANGVLIDQLKYTYNTIIPDQLYTVYDSSGSAKGFIGGAAGSHYTYDANGNLTSEPYQGITHISYNVLNRTDTTVITAGSTYITYTYDAGGMLLRKKAYNSGTLTQTDYIGGFVYTGNGTTQTLAYAPMPEGRLLGTALTQEFVIADPQGNARVSFQNNSGVAKVTQENSYYGYGLLMPGSLVGWSAPPNKNLYNGGSEWQNDTKAVNAGVPDYYQTFYRNYDPALARFIAVDPMAEGASDMSVFQYARDNPIMGNDPGGDLAAVKLNNPPPVNNTFAPIVAGGGDGGTLDPLTGEGSLDGQDFGGVSDDVRSDFSYYWNGQIDHAMVAINMLNRSISSAFAIAASYGVYATGTTSGIDPGASGTVQNPDSQSENIPSGPIIDNHLYIQFQPDESLFSDPGTDPYNFAGNLFHIPINAIHQVPENGSQLTQLNAFTCGFYTAAAVLRYLGKTSDGFGLLRDYSSVTNNTLEHFMAHGITFSSTLDELTPFLNNYFSGGYTDNPGMILFFGHPIIAFLNEGLNSDGSTLGHIVFLTGVSSGTYNSITGTGLFSFTYWDPQTGFYQNTSPSNLYAPYAIKGPQ